MHFNEFELDEANASLRRRGKPVALAPTPFELLCTLARRPGTLLNKHTLLDDVWGHQHVSDSVLKTAISDLRTVLGDDPRQPRFIETVSRRGYRFIAVPVAMPAAGTPVQAVPAASEGRVVVHRSHGRDGAAAQPAGTAALGGQRAVVWIAGEPGIGKTTLIEHFVAGLGDVACVRGQCVDLYGAGEPYLPVLEALAELCRSDSELPALLRAVAPTWLLQLPWLSTADERDALRRDLAGVGPERMLREIGQLFDRYTERRPLLLVTEDLHWSDRATLQLIDYMARRRGSARFMWLASFRLAEVVALDHPLNPLRHELRLHGLCAEIVLDPFSESRGGRLRGRAFAVAGRRRSLRPRAAWAHRRAAAVRRHGDDRGHDARRRRPRHRSRRLPFRESLATLIDHYIARLGDEQRALLSAAGLCGAEFRVGTVARALERDAAWVDQACDELVRQQIWLKRTREGQASEPTYAFRHALFRQVLVERTAAAVRAQLHRKVGAALESERAAGLPVTPAELAMHFERGREPMRALHHYVEAAQAALLRLSPGECMSLTERATLQLDLADEGTERDALELDLSTLRGLAAFHLQGRRSKPRRRSSARMRCWPRSRSIRGAACCCTTSVSCSACARSTPRRLRSRSARRRSPPRATTRSFGSPPAPCTAQVRLVQGGHQAARACDRERAACAGIERTWTRLTASRRSACSACSACTCFTSVWSGRRTRACSRPTPWRPGWASRWRRCGSSGWTR